MEVRQATRADLLEIARIAHASLRSASGTLVRPSTVDAALDAEYSPSTLDRRVREGCLVVAVGDGGHLMGFAEAGVADGTLAVRIHAPDGNARRSDWVRTAVTALRRGHPGRPAHADVLLGDLACERSCEAAGFVPGEVIQRLLHGEPVVERRWWDPVPP